MKVRRTFDGCVDIGKKEHMHIRKYELRLERVEVLYMCFYFYEPFTKQWKPCVDFKFRVGGG
jgi:hypothetical protein